MIGIFTDEQEELVQEILNGYEFNAYVQVWEDTIQVDGDLTKSDIEMLAKLAEKLL